MEDLKLSNIEQEYFEKIFEYCTDEEVDSSNGPENVVSASKVKETFVLSNIESKFLKNIWSICANK